MPQATRAEQAALRKLIDDVRRAVPGLTWQQAVDLIDTLCAAIDEGCPPASHPTLLALQLAGAEGLPPSLEDITRTELAAAGISATIEEVQGVLVAFGHAVEAPYPV